MMKVLAILTVRNERRFIERCLEHHIGQGLSVHVIDNGSTDGTVEIIESWLGRGVIQLDHQPWTGAFELREQLRRKETIAAASSADWFVHIDADERREAPMPYANLVEALDEVDRRGFNAVDFDEFVFVPTAEDPDFDAFAPDGAGYEERMRWYYHYEPTSTDRLRINAWKRTPGVDLVTLAGHHVTFPGQRVFPRPFVMRHYPVLSEAHAIEKYGSRVFAHEELADSWHGDRAAFNVRRVGFPSRERLREMGTTIADRRTLDPADPWDRHPFLDADAGPARRSERPDPGRQSRVDALRAYAAAAPDHIPQFPTTAPADRSRTNLPNAISGASVPLWSVMLPIRNPQPEQLEEALRSVLQQDPGPARMQISVVDDASVDGDSVAELVQRVGQGRISYSRNAEPLGLAGNWNEAVRLSEGELVHLLHQDDRVTPGFYDRLGRPLANDPSLVGAYCRVSGFNAAGEVTWTPQPEQAEAGILVGLDTLEAEEHRMIVAGVVVRRSAYELLGGYRTDLPYCTDWDFLKRLSFLGPVWYEPMVLAHWRQHPAQETERLAKTGTDLADRRRSIDLSMAFLPPETRSRIRFGAYRSSLDFGIESLRTQTASGELEAALSQARQIVETLERLADPSDAGRSQNAEEPAQSTPTRGVRASELAAAHKRIEMLEAQLKGWVEAVRYAQKLNPTRVIDDRGPQAPHGSTTS